MKMDVCEMIIDESNRCQTYKLKMSSKHFRKRRRKRNTFVPYLVDCLRPFMMLILHLFILSILITQLSLNRYLIVSGQVVKDSPKSRSDRHNLVPSFNRTNDVRRGSRRPTFSPMKAENQNLDMSNLRFDERTDRRDELLRRLSSTMLLETLLRKPIRNNKSPFPTLMLPTFFESAQDTSSQTINRHDQSFGKRNLKDEFSRVKFAQRNKEHNRMGHVSTMDVSTTNLTNSISTEHPSSKPIITLDMLIRNEYDSRIKPMLKTLKDQRKLSTSNPSRVTTTKAVPINHKLSDNSSDTATTALDLTFSQMGTDTTKPPPKENVTVEPSTISSKVNTTETISDENGDEYEDVEEDDASNGESAANVTSSTTATPSTSKKILRNVPPYQLNSFAYDPIERPTMDDQRLESKRNTTGLAVDQVMGSSSNKSPEKTFDRGSMIYSDGEEEAASRRRNGINFTRNYENSDKDIGQGAATKSDKLGDNFLLNHLFSTMNPLIDFNTKGREFTNSAGGQMNVATENPLFYKGYVGRDDHLVSTTASDWSRHIGNNRSLYGGSSYAPGGMIPIMTTTNAPPTEPTTVPYNYYLNQPVTNAQSVPDTVIPTSDPSDYTSTGMPMISSPNLSKKISIQSNHGHPSHGTPPTMSPERVPNVIIREQKYSYQIPDRQGNKSDKSQVYRLVPTVVTSQEESSESEPDNKNATTSSMFNQTAANWTPTKFGPDKAGSNNKRKPAPPYPMNHTSVLLVETDSNSSSSKTFPIVEAKSRKQADHSNRQGDVDNDSDGLTRNVIGNYASSQNGSDTYSHGDSRSKTGLKRNKLKNNSSGDRSSDMSDDGSLNSTTIIEDDETDDDASSANKFSSTGGDGKGRSRVKVKGNDRTRETFESEDNGTSEDQYETDGDSFEKPATKPRKNVQQVTKLKGKYVPENGTNQERATGRVRTNQFVSHEPSGSEVISSGPDDRFQRPASSTNGRNITKAHQHNHITKLVHFHPPTRATESIMVSGNERPDINAAFPTNQDIGHSGSHGTAIIPNPNFYGEASSERPIMDNSISILNTQNNKMANQPGLTQIDPYQKTSSNTILSTILQPFSTTTATHSTTTAPKPSVSTTIPGPKEATEDTSGSVSNPTTIKTSSKGSNDRLAFILIGGSCVLSVVCLVLAAMSMRFQDMCDDYKSLRNAEKAALKLQKHRLKYMKSHQINRFKHGGGPDSSGSRQILIDGMHLDGVNNPVESDLNNGMRLARAQNNINNKSIQFQNNWSDQNNCRAAISALLNGQRCGCENCASRRLLAHDDSIVAGGGKQAPWLSHCLHTQGHTRLTPLFGAGSSVGTFFPKRHDDHIFRASGSADAQILIDSQPTHGCSAGITRSKSILSRSNNNLASNKHATVFESACRLGNHECDHANHNRHICHNHLKCHHHNQTNETLASDESELTIDDSHVTCGNPHCTSNHHHSQQQDQGNNRIRLMHLAKLNNQLSSGWKKQLTDQVRVTNQRSNGGGTFQQDHHHSRFTNNHHHHHQQTTSDDSSSPAQCTCTRDHQPLISATRHHSPNKTNHKRLAMQHDLRAAAKQQARRDKSMPVWSTNRDRLI